jgi:hypothetical protein
MARWTEALVGAPAGSIASRVPDADAEWRNRMLACLEAARQAPPPEPVEVANPGHLLGKALTVAHGLDEPDTATMLLAPFQIEMLERIHAPALAQVAAHYGESWTRDLVGVWFGRDRPGSAGVHVAAATARELAGVAADRVRGAARDT